MLGDSKSLTFAGVCYSQYDIGAVDQVADQTDVGTKRRLTERESQGMEIRSCRCLRHLVSFYFRRIVTTVDFPQTPFALARV